MILRAKRFWFALRTFANPWIIYQQKLGLVKGSEVTLKLRRGPRLIAPATRVDIQVVRDTFQFHHWEPTTEFVVRDGWRVLDLGAHIGTYSVLAAWGRPETTVWAVEPASKNSEYLCRNISINHLKNVRPSQAAVMAQSGTATLKMAEESWGHSVIQDVTPGNATRSTAVQAMTLDDLIRSVDAPIDLIKMDIEGAELDILRNCPADSLSKVRRIMLEYHAVPPLEAAAVGSELTQLLTSHGFKCGRNDAIHLLHGTREGV